MAHKSSSTHLTCIAGFRQGKEAKAGQAILDESQCESATYSVLGPMCSLMMKGQNKKNLVTTEGLYIPATYLYIYHQISDKF